MIGRLIGLMLPPRCGICGRACAPTTPICASCASYLQACPVIRAFVPGTREAWSLGPHEGVLRELVLALKYRARLGLAEAAAAAIVDRRELPACAALVPIPPAPARRRARGYDPATEIARALTRATGLELNACLTRTDGPRQVGRTRAERRDDPPQITTRAPPPLHAILIDDVLTTGATLHRAAQALQQSGTKTIQAITIARA